MKTDTGKKYKSAAEAGAAVAAGVAEGASRTVKPSSAYDGQ